MASSEQVERNRQELQALADRLYSELYEWRAKHPEASLDQIAAQVTPRRRRLMGEWIAQLACQDGNGPVVEGISCPHCGQPLLYKGDAPRQQEHLEGEIELKRAYCYCPACQEGIFPPR